MAEITHESVALYVLDALDETDRPLFEAHLAGCEPCHAAVETLAAAACSLAFAVAPVTPPPSLRARVLEAARVPPR